MCPLRVVLIFLSATLAGFFVLRRLKAGVEEEAPAVEGCCPKESLSLTEKVANSAGGGNLKSMDFYVPVSASILLVDLLLRIAGQVCNLLGILDVRGYGERALLVEESGRRNVGGSGKKL
ncbi:hypothetical protein HPP92_017487 [Vanilla planifolia]|uniref:Uncharacterized protein n=1 Tax=Vanilla planifolia TaxID=51239 RepID=A0A835ULZ6_VANPL|nr:hypothetical protein HPP92_017487 [Vanilla planifolia]